MEGEVKIQGEINIHPLSMHGTSKLKKNQQKEEQNEML